VAILFVLYVVVNLIIVQWPKEKEALKFTEMDGGAYLL
jgi:hypothetical protein